MIKVQIDFEILNCFLGAKNKELEGDDSVDETIRNVFALFWKAKVLLAAEVLSCFQK